MREFLGRWFGRQPHAVTRRPGFAPLHLEQLETRRQLSIAYNPLLAQATITGGQYDDTIEVSYSAGFVSMHQGSAQLGSSSLLLPLPMVWSINLDAGDGPDIISVRNMPTSTRVNINGGADHDDLRIEGPANTWRMTAAQAGTVNGNISFSQVEDRHGIGMGSDHFYIPNGVNVGLLDGGGGTDTLDFSAWTTPVYLALSRYVNGVEVADLNGGLYHQELRDFERYIGGTATDILVSYRPDPETWHITDWNMGDINGLIRFQSFEDLNGGHDEPNTFVFSNGKGVSGTITGATTVDYSAYTTPVAIGENGTVTGVGGGYWALSLSATLIGGQASDTLMGNGTWRITDNNAGTLNSQIFRSFENLAGVTYANSSPDGNQYIFSPGKSISGQVTGGAGGLDVLDYTAYSTAVTVDLATGAATSTSGVGGIEVVVGGSSGDILRSNTTANSILVGNGGADLLQGGSGRDILIGGNGVDSLFGGGNDDLLLDGGLYYQTLADQGSYGSYWLAMKVILDEWSRTDRSYSQRVSAMRTGQFKLDNSTVWSDYDQDTLYGQTGTDWFWGVDLTLVNQSLFNPSPPKPRDLLPDWSGPFVGPVTIAEQLN